jgi:hypothetical protein
MTCIEVNIANKYPLFMASDYVDDYGEMREVYQKIDSLQRVAEVELMLSSDRQVFAADDRVIYDFWFEWSDSAVVGVFGQLIWSEDSYVRLFEFGEDGYRFDEMEPDETANDYLVRVRDFMDLCWGLYKYERKHPKQI